MDDHQTALQTGKKHCKIADHILTQTYPLVKDPRLLVVVMENLYKACDYTMTAVLELDRLQKKIPAFHTSYADRMRVFRARNTRRYGFQTAYLNLLGRLHEYQREKKESPVEFARKNKYVLADEDYKLSQLTPTDLQSRLEMAKLFIQDVEHWIENHE